MTRGTGSVSLAYAVTRHHAFVFAVMRGVRAVVAVSVVTTAALCAAVEAHASADGFVIMASARSASPADQGFAPAVRMQTPAPASVDPPISSATTNRSSCRADLPDAVMTIVIADIGYACPVYRGGQDMLDAGAATMISDAALNSAVTSRPGGRGTLWIAGHRLSHGGPFAEIANLDVGALVIVDDGQSTASYRVVDKDRFELRNDRVIDASGNATGEATLNSILRTDHGASGAPRLLIQTCDGSTARWMVYADLVSISTPGS